MAVETPLPASATGANQIEVPDFIIPRPTVEVIPENRRTIGEGGERFDRRLSGVGGVDLIVEPGTRPQFSPYQVKRMQADTDRIATYRGYEAVFLKAKDRLQRVALRTGFRGISSTRGNYDATIYPQRERTYDPDLLRRSTGDFYQELVREEGRVEVVLPIGTDEDSIQRTEALTKTIASALIAEGRPADQVLGMVTARVVQRLDEQKMHQFIGEGRFKLLRGAVREKIKQWNTPVRQRVSRFTPKRQRKNIAA